MCRSHLNLGFRQVEKFHCKLMKDFKSKLPRRESERRNHPLIKHCDILTAIETRISLLAMTFMKYVDADMVCFFPGKVIDEIYEVLSRIKMDKNPPKAYEMLQVLTPFSPRKKVGPSFKWIGLSFRSSVIFLPWPWSTLTRRSCLALSLIPRIHHSF